MRTSASAFFFFSSSWRIFSRCALGIYVSLRGASFYAKASLLIATFFAAAGFRAFPSLPAISINTGFTSFFSLFLSAISATFAMRAASYA